MKSLFSTPSAGSRRTDIDLNTNANTAESVPFDLDMNARIVGLDVPAYPDMGCYETPDTDTPPGSPGSSTLFLIRFTSLYTRGDRRADLNRDGALTAADVAIALTRAGGR